MKKILIPIGALLLSNIAQAQLSSTENYVQSRTYLEPVTASSSTARQIETVQYFDGLGRPKQVVNVKASPLGRDVVTPILYDGFGRQVMNFLPVPQQGTNNGGIYPQQSSGNFPVGDPTGVYTGGKAFSEKVLENSPLDRVLQQKQVGMAWSNKPVQFGYDTNTVQDAVKRYSTVTTWVEGATSSALSQSSSYGAAQLYKNTVTDEDGNISIEFKNGKGQVLLVRKVLSDTEKTDTYYVYNEYDQLAFVISPKAAIEADPVAVLSDLCYQYRYDGRGRLVEKKLPGKGWEYMAYDKADRLIMTQDAELRKSSKWLITKYDQLGRVAYTGIIPGGSRTDMQSQSGAYVISETREQGNPFTRNGMLIYYTNNLFYQIETVLSVSYYDTYPPGTPTIPTQILGQEVLPQDSQNSPVSTKSLPVASFVKNIEDDNWTKNYIGYDKKGRTIGTYSFNHLGGCTKVESVLDFAGAVQQTITRHKRLDSDTDRIITENFTYDSQNRLLTHTHQVDNNQTEYLAQNTYNELSQLQNKKVGGVSPSAPLQQVNYQYNIRGWMTKINDPKNLNGKLFGYEVKYNSIEGLETPNVDYTNLKVKPRYNGNIAEVDWRTGTASGDNLRRYGYVYDGLNRLSAGFYQKDSNPSAKEYFEKMDYDLNGNITYLRRSAESEQGAPAFNIDDLAYVYANNNKSNRLSTVTDSSTDYRGYPDTSGTIIPYDENGNMIAYADKGIKNIYYNYLNQISNMVFDQTYIPRVFSRPVNVRSTYLYSSSGEKLRKAYYHKNPDPFASGEEVVTTDYLNGFQYESKKINNNPSIFALKFIPTAEGYYNFENNKYIYNYADHLGNIRLSYFNNGSSIEVLEENNYYPFGLKQEGYNATAGNPSYQYKYNGKELQVESGMYDYGARFYMPDIGRWGVIDPKSQYTHESYSYVWNNPIRFADPTGMTGEDPIYGPKGGELIKGVVVSASKPLKTNMAGLSFTHQNFAPAIPVAAYLLEAAYYALVGYAAWDIADKATDAIKNRDLSEQETNEETNTDAPEAFPDLEEEKDVNGVPVPDDSGIEKPHDMSIPDPFNKRGGGKNERKINQKRETSWKDKEADARKRLTEAKRNGETKKVKAQIQKEIDHAVLKQRTSEPHGVANKR